MTDPGQDLKDRWLPSPEQRAAAETVLRAGWEAAWTVQILRNKTYGFWTTDVVVETPVGVFPDRESASQVVQALVDQLHAQGVEATGSYALHFLREDKEEAAVFEDIMTARRKGRT